MIGDATREENDKDQVNVVINVEASGQEKDDDD